MKNSVNTERLVVFQMESFISICDNILQKWVTMIIKIRYNAQQHNFITQISDVVMKSRITPAYQSLWATQFTYLRSPLVTLVTFNIIKDIIEMK